MDTSGNNNNDSKNEIKKAAALINSKEQKNIEEAFKKLSIECKKDAMNSKAFYYRG